MEERSLRITGADKTFFNKITNTLTKILIPTKVGINGMLISIKRNSMIKALEHYTAEDENYDKEELEKIFRITRQICDGFYIQKSKKQYSVRI